MEFSIFWSWQSDAPDKCNRRFIREALDQAVQEITEDAAIVESPRVESGMENTPGTPDVAQVMFDKIERSDVILCDVSLVGSIPILKKEGICKKVPNPNVMAEMGNGAGRMGWDRVICVMNEHYGERSELPFDVKSKRHPIDYKLDPENMGDVAKVKRDLTKWLKIAIQTCIDAEHQAVVDAIAKLDILCLVVCSVFRNTDYYRDLNQTPELKEDLKGVIDVAAFRLTVQRLLDLGLLRTDAQGDKYAYHWTYRGIRLLAELKNRNAFKEPPVAGLTLPPA